MIIETNTFSRIFSKKVSMFKFINEFISLFIRETIRSIALEKIFVKQSFQNFIFKHSYRYVAYITNEAT